MANHKNLKKVIAVSSMAAATMGAGAMVKLITFTNNQHHHKNQAFQQRFHQNHNLLNQAAKLF